MRSARLLPCVLGLLLAACGATSPFRFGMSELQEQLDSQPRLFTDADIASLEALAPQLPVPFRLGVAPPLGMELDYWTDWRWRNGPTQHLTFGTWSAEEARAIEDLGRRFRDAGIVSELVLLPGLLVQGTSSEAPDALLSTLRQAAARNHVDAVLVVNRVSASQSHASFLSVLDLTIVGAFVVPSYEISSMTVMEAALVDTRNGYLYASARGDGAVEHHAAATRTEKWMEKGEAEARVAALVDLGERLRVQASFVCNPRGSR